MFLGEKMYHLLWHSTLIWLKKGLLAPYTIKNAMKIHIRSFSSSFAILSPFPVHVRHNDKVCWRVANLSWFQRASTTKTDGSLHRALGQKPSR